MYQNFQTKERAYEYINSLKLNGRFNILLSDDYEQLSQRNRFSDICFDVMDGLLIPKNNFGFIMPKDELRHLVEYLKNTLEKFDEESSILNEIKSIEEYIFSIKSNVKQQNTQPTKHGYVYLICGENGRYKIGMSKNPKKRVSDLSLSSCEKHILVHHYKTDDMQGEEHRLHSMFGNKRSHSEWFDLDIEDVDYIKGL